MKKIMMILVAGLIATGVVTPVEGAVKKKKDRYAKVQHGQVEDVQKKTDEVLNKMLSFMALKPISNSANREEEVRGHLNAVQEGKEKISDYDYLKPIVRYLLSGGDYGRVPEGLIRGLLELGAPTASVGTPLHVACILADEKEICKQLEEKADVNATYQFPTFPEEEKRGGSVAYPPMAPINLLFKIHPERVDLAELLLRHGAKHQFMGSAFSNAVQEMLRRAKTAEEFKKQLPMMELLLKSGVSPEGKFGKSNPQIPFALWYACKLGSPGAVQLLIKYGADAKFTANTPCAMYSQPYLHAACGDTPNKLKVLKILLEAGAKPGTKNDKGQTAVQYAESQGFNEAAKLLRAHGGAGRGSKVP